MLDLEGILIKFQLQVYHRTEDALDGWWTSLISVLSSATEPHPEACLGTCSGLVGPGRGVAFSVQFTHSVSLELSFWRK